MLILGQQCRKIWSHFKRKKRVKIWFRHQLVTNFILEKRNAVSQLMRNRVISTFFLCWWQDSNLRPLHYEWSALPAVLHQHDMEFTAFRNGQYIIYLYLLQNSSRNCRFPWFFCFGTHSLLIGFISFVIEAAFSPSNPWKRPRISTCDSRTRKTQRGASYPS